MLRESLIDKAWRATPEERTERVVAQVLKGEARVGWRNMERRVEK